MFRHGFGLIASTLIMSAVLSGCSGSQADTRLKVSLNGIWDFYPNGESERHDIRVPSFWDAPQDYDYPPEWLHMMHGIYKKTFVIPESMADKTILLAIDRISVIARVFVNDQQVGGEKTGGFLMMQLPYKIDITGVAKVGQGNTLEVRMWGGQQETYGEDVPTHWKEKDFPAEAVDDGKMLYPWCVDHYDGRRGIDGDVAILAYPKLHIDNVFVMPELQGNGDASDDEISIRTKIVNESDESRSVRLSHSIEKISGGGKKSLPVQTIELAPGESKIVDIAKQSWTDAAYWWPRDPQLYMLRTEMMDENGVVDRLDTRFGFREFRVNGNHFELNGLPINLRTESFEFSWHEGYNHGPSAGPVLSTKELTVDTQKELLKAYKSLNLNALRVHKASGIEATYDFCDEIGLLVIHEAPFWQTQQRTDERAKDNFQNWVRQWITVRRNHPSIVMWSICNECWTSPIPQFTYTAAKETDPTRPAYHQGVRPNDFEGDIKCVHYTGGYPFEAFNTPDLYSLYRKDAEKPKSEGESYFAEGWPVKNRDGSINHNRVSERGSNSDPDMVSQAEWLRGTSRFIRAMRFAGLADARLYMDWIYCFNPIPADIRPVWTDLSAPEIKPVVLHRPVCNTFTDKYPTMIEAKGIEYWRDTYSPVAVFDVQFDKNNRLGVAPEIYKPGQTLNREFVIYNDELTGGEDLTVTWELGRLDPQNDDYAMMKQGHFDIKVPYGEKRLSSITETLPADASGPGWLLLTLRASKQNLMKFEEMNRLGALVSVPLPKLVLYEDELELDEVPAGELSQFRKVILTNVGGKLSEKWSMKGGEDVIRFARRSGNCRGEEEIFFQVDAANLNAGSTQEREVVFEGDSGSSAKLMIRFKVI